MVFKALLAAGILIPSVMYNYGDPRGLLYLPVDNSDVADSGIVDTVSPPMFMEGSMRYGMDTTVSACNNFYDHVNGDWRDKAILPNNVRAPFITVNSFVYAYDRMLKQMEVLFDSARYKIDDTSEPALQAIGAFYESCMSADTLENPRIIRRSRSGMLSRSPGDTIVQPVKDTTRQEKCRNRVLQYLGGAAGQIYIQELIASGAVTHMEEILVNIRREVVERLKNNSIMTADEKEYALERLSRLVLRVGIPEEMIDYSGLKLSPDDYEGNKKEVYSFSNLQWAGNLGANTRELWKMSLLRPNASYLPFEHAIEVPPIMFSAPFFYHEGPEVLNYAGIGYVIGHEIFHSVAPQVFDMESEEMKGEIERLKEFNSSLGELDGWKTDGKRSVNEDIADLGGARIAYSAWKSASKSASADTSIEGFTQDQLYFVGIARVWRAAWEGEPPRMPHAPGFARANGIAKQMPEFARAFGCTSKDSMYMHLDSMSRIW